MCTKIGSLDENALINCCKTSMSSKLIGADSDFFSKMCIDAINRVKTINHQGKPKYPLGAINIVKAHGHSSLDSRVIDGYVLMQTRASQQMPTKIENAKIACIDFNLNKFRCAMGIQITIDDPKALTKVREK